MSTRSSESVTEDTSTLASDVIFLWALADAGVLNSKTEHQGR